MVHTQCKINTKSNYINNFRVAALRLTKDKLEYGRSMHLPILQLVTDTFYAVSPPSTVNSDPVTNDASGLAKNATAAAISSAVP